MSKRHYHVLFSRPGGWMNWPGGNWTSNVSIRAFAASVFRQWYGRYPDGLRWHIKGQMAQCEDKQGNRLYVEQTNKQRCPCCGHVGWPREFSRKFIGHNLDVRCLTCAEKPMLALPCHAQGGES